MELYTYQDFKADIRGGSYFDICAAVKKALDRHRQNPMLRTAVDADLYDRQINPTVMRYAKWLYNKSSDTPAHRMSNNFFHKLNTQRTTYSLGNGLTFSDDRTAEQLGQRFDTVMRDAGYAALIHGVSFIFWTVSGGYVFRLTEFCPLWDEDTGALMAGIRFWQVGHDKPVQAILYEVDGFTRLRAPRQDAQFEVVEEKRPYAVKTIQAPADAEPEVIGEENYASLPIIPMYGSRLKQSTLVGVRGHLDAYDLIQSGFANDLESCSEIYWLVTNAGGMDDTDLAKFRERLRREHIANIQDADDVSVTPYTQEVPYTTRQAFLQDLRSQIYEDFGALDVHTIAAGATNDHIDAAYQSLDENADDFEYEVIQTTQNLLKLLGIEDTPVFKRNRISNQKEQVEMILSAANYLDDRTILSLLPFISPDQIDSIMEAKGVDDINRWQPPEAGAE